MPQLHETKDPTIVALSSYDNVILKEINVVNIVKPLFDSSWSCAIKRFWRIPQISEPDPTNLVPIERPDLMNVNVVS